MKKNGFTLIELLAVIVIIGVIMSLSVTTILKAKENTEKALSNEQIKSVKDAGELLGVDLDDYYSDIYNCDDTSWIRTTSGVSCDVENNVWKKVSLDIADLRNHGYFQDAAGHCSGKVSIIKTDSGYTVELEQVTC